MAIASKDEKNGEEMVKGERKENKEKGIGNKKQEKLNMTRKTKQRKTYILLTMQEK